MNRDTALALMHEYTASDALRKHMYAVEIAMRAMAEKHGADPDAWAYGVHASISTDDGGGVIVAFGGEGANWVDSPLDPLAVELRTGGSVFSLSAPLREGASLDGNVEVGTLDPSGHDTPFAAVYGLDASLDPIRAPATRLGFRCVR